jgi:hypothetical protein
VTIMRGRFLEIYTSKAKTTGKGLQFDNIRVIFINSRMVMYLECRLSLKLKNAPLKFKREWMVLPKTVDLTTSDYSTVCNKLG